MKRTLFIFLGLAVLFTATTVLADPSATGQFTFQPIIPVQSLPLPTNGSLCSYLNAVFKLSITVAVALAVIMIVIDGFKYMTSEAIGKKGEALAGIRSALGGLILLLASWLLLFIINPQITSLSVVSMNGGALGGVCGTNSATVNTAAFSDNGTQASTPSPLLTTTPSSSDSTNVQWYYIWNGSKIYPSGSQSDCENARQIDYATNPSGTSASCTSQTTTGNAGTASSQCVWFNDQQICGTSSPAPSNQTPSSVTPTNKCVTFNNQVICDDNSGPK